MLETFIALIVCAHILQRKKTEKHEKVCKDHDYCYVEMPNEGNKILKYNRVEKSMKHPFTKWVIKKAPKIN